jgi:hypothetical protein
MEEWRFGLEARKCGKGGRVDVGLKGGIFEGGRVEWKRNGRVEG